MITKLKSPNTVFNVPNCNKMIVSGEEVCRILDAKLSGGRIYLFDKSPTNRQIIHRSLDMDTVIGVVVDYSIDSEQNFSVSAKLFGRADELTFENVAGCYVGLISEHENVDGSRNFKTSDVIGFYAIAGDEIYNKEAVQ